MLNKIHKEVNVNTNNNKYYKLQTLPGMKPWVRGLVFGLLALFSVLVFTIEIVRTSSSFMFVDIVFFSLATLALSKLITRLISKEDFYLRQASINLKLSNQDTYLFGIRESKKFLRDIITDQIAWIDIIAFPVLCLIVTYFHPESYKLLAPAVVAAQVRGIYYLYINGVYEDEIQKLKKIESDAYNGKSNEG